MSFSGAWKQSAIPIKLLITALLLRSLIASGYMLDINSANADWPTAVLCPGALSVAVFRKQQYHHHHQSDEPARDDHDEHENTLTACGFWVAGAQLLLAAPMLFMLSEALSSTIQVHYRHPYLETYKNYTRLTRAPPLPV